MGIFSAVAGVAQGVLGISAARESRSAARRRRESELQRQVLQNRRIIRETRQLVAQTQQFGVATGAGLERTSAVEGQRSSVRSASASETFRGDEITARLNKAARGEQRAQDLQSLGGTIGAAGGVLQDFSDLGGFGQLRILGRRLRGLGPTDINPVGTGGATRLPGLGNIPPVGTGGATRIGPASTDVPLQNTLNLRRS